MRRAPAKRESSLFFPFFVSSTLFLFFFVLARPSITKTKKTSFYTCCCCCFAPFPCFYLAKTQNQKPLKEKSKKEVRGGNFSTQRSTRGRFFLRSYRLSDPSLTTFLLFLLEGLSLSLSLGVEKRSCSALCFPSALSLSREPIDLERVPSSTPPSPRWRPVSVENRNDGDLEAAISPSLFFIAPLRKKSQTGTYRRRGVLSCPALGDCFSSITAFVDFSSPLMEERDAMMAKKCAPHGHADFVRRKQASNRRGACDPPLVLWQRNLPRRRPQLLPRA